MATLTIYDENLGSSCDAVADGLLLANALLAARKKNSKAAIYLVHKDVVNHFYFVGVLSEIIAKFV